MDKISGGEPGIQFEAPPSPESLEPGSDEKFEKQVSGQESAVSRTPSKAMPQIPPANASSSSVVQSPTGDDQLTAQPVAPALTAGLTASDGDVIEKSWVDKTKVVIAKTRNDPHAQKDAVSQIKADYIQKRFKKEINKDDVVAA